MNAYHLAMLFIFINAGILIVASIDVFGSDITEGITIMNLFESDDPEGNILGHTIVPISFAATIIGLTIVMFLGSVRVVGSTAGPSSQGWAYVAFTITFWISCWPAFDVMNSIANRIPGFTIFVGIFALVSLLIFIMALVQLALTGVKSHG